MKKHLYISLCAIALVGAVILLSADSCNENPTSRALDKSLNTAATAQSAVPTPDVSYFAERRTIARWSQRWDKPDVPTYVYLISFGKVIGYYVCNGKPASTQSYLIPETAKMPNYDLTMDAPDIDGTYGANNPGIRFFTASGVAVEWAGSGASYIYSDAILPLDVPLLGK